MRIWRIKLRRKAMPSLQRSRSKNLGFVGKPSVLTLSLTELGCNVPAIRYRQPRLLFVIGFGVFCPLLAFGSAGFEDIELIHAAILPRKS